VSDPGDGIGSKKKRGGACCIKFIVDNTLGGAMRGRAPGSPASTVPRAPHVVAQSRRVSKSCERKAHGRRCAGAPSTIGRASGLDVASIADRLLLRAVARHVSHGTMVTYVTIARSYRARFDRPGGVLLYVPGTCDDGSGVALTTGGTAMRRPLRSAGAYALVGRPSNIAFTRHAWPSDRRVTLFGSFTV
jgi:hypothetical protein